MNALLAQFIPEARDLLEQAGTGMLALERNAAAPGVINDVFRAVHTLKGSSGLFDVRPLTHLIHAAEDLLGELRVGTLALDSDIVDKLLDSLDVVSRWVDALESSEALPPDAEAVTAARVTVLRQWLEPQRAEPALAGTAAEPIAASSLPPPAWVLALPEAQRLTIVGQSQQDALIAWTFIPEDDCFFRGDDPLAIVRQSPGLLAVRVLARKPLCMQSIDPLTSLLQFEVLSGTTPAQLEEHLRYVMDAVEWRVLATEALAVASGSVAKGPVFADFARLARQHLAAGAGPALSRSLDSLARMIAPDSIQASALRWCSAEIAKHGLARPDRIARWIQVIETGAMADVAAAAPCRAEGVKPAIITAHQDLAREIARTQVDMLSTAAMPGLESGRLEAAGTVLRRLVQALGEDRWSAPLAAALREARGQGSPEPLRMFVAALHENPAAPEPMTPMAPVPVPEVAASVEPPPAEAAGEHRTAPRVLRVDQSKIDAIMNLVAELIVAKNGLSYLATRAEQVHGSRAAAREIKDQFAVIDRITQGLQVGVMSVRMMPVSQVFQRFPRLVRDIARKLGKTIELVIEGEDTEADKNVLESLADPLIHMVRNSLDHGIETPEERRAAGKTVGGTLRISARQESDFVVIEVADDGRGINPEVVKAKAVAQGLITSEQAAAMDDVEAANLVFAAGFSTKDTVSDLSGRGVGMDVVRSAVTKAGGAVSLQSRLGHGTTVTVRLPLTMAVTRIVTIACRDRLFGIPMDLVVETVKIGREQIHRIKEVETFVLRESVVPLVRLDTVLGLSQPDDGEREEEAVMVVNIGRDRIGLIVDGFRERLEVIVKPLDGLLEGLPHFSGTALLGDGRVLLILDPQKALSCR